MIAVVFFVVLRIILAQDTTYYVSTTGSDSFSCGSKDSPCASINQVVINNPNQAFTVSVDEGNYTGNAIILIGSAYITVQGTGKTVITTGNNVGAYIVNGLNTGIEFHDVTIVLGGSGNSFITLLSAGNNASFYNVVVNFTDGYTGNFIELNGGNLTVVNLTVDSQTLDSYLVYDSSINDNSTICITGSTFTNLNVTENGAVLVFDAYGAANVTFNNSIISNITADNVFIGFWAEDVNQQVVIANNSFSNTYTYIATVYIENDNQLGIAVQNCTWFNATSNFVSGALETLGPDTADSYFLLLDSLRFTNCNGPYAGALLVGYNALVLSNSVFVDNIGDVANDVVQGVDDTTSSFPYDISNSTSTSHLPKAVIWNLDSGSTIDISDQLPFPPYHSSESKAPRVKRVTRAEITASPKGGRKPRRN